MANPTFDCECMHVHQDVKDSTDLQNLETNVFNKQGYKKSKDENVYFVHDNIKADFEEVYEDLPQGDN